MYVYTYIYTYLLSRTKVTECGGLSRVDVRSFSRTAVVDQVGADRRGHRLALGDRSQVVKRLAAQSKRRRRRAL